MKLSTMMINVAGVLLFGCTPTVQGCRFDSDCGNTDCNECDGNSFGLTLGTCRPINIGLSCCIGRRFGVCKLQGSHGLAGCEQVRRNLLGDAETDPARRLQDDQCEVGGGLEGDPHMQGLRGQRINWSGVDGGWYSLIKDDDTDVDINVRVTAPLPDEFPDRQLVTSLAVLSEGHSLVIKVENPYTTDTDGCPEGVSPCLANGGLRIFVDDQEEDGLLRFSRQVSLGDGAISVSASNLPVECRKFGGHKIWGRMYQEILEGRRRLDNRESFEDWILKSDHMPAPRWCGKYIAENGLADMQSTHAIFKIETPTLTVRLDAGVNYQGDGELDWDGRVLPDLEFWQMDVAVDGLDVEHSALSGLLGETARPVYDENGNEVMAGFEAFRGTVEDYRVSNALGVHFPLLDKKKERVEGHE
ncbi:unnamed protein product [Ectocarpus sp. 12 AP-2014]